MIELKNENLKKEAFIVFKNALIIANTANRAAKRAIIVARIAAKDTKNYDVNSANNNVIKTHSAVLIAAREIKIARAAYNEII